MHHKKISLERKWVYPQWLSEQEPIIKPQTFSHRILAEDAVLCFSFHLFSHLCDAFGLDEGDEGPRFPGTVHYRAKDEVALFQGSFGGPAAGILMETLIASGVERIVMVGKAGSISPKCTLGDLFLPSWGVREEGTSYHYLPSNNWCEVSEGLYSVIQGYFEVDMFLKGGVWSTDAPFRETMDKVQRYAEHGVLAVEMECTTLMAIAVYREVDFVAILVITDELYSGKWVRGLGSERVKNCQDYLCQTLADGFYQGGGFV